MVNSGIISYIQRLGLEPFDPQHLGGEWDSSAFKQPQCSCTQITTTNTSVGMEGASQEIYRFTRCSFRRNRKRHMCVPLHTPLVPRSSHILFAATDSMPYVLHGLVAVHVRRGDYEGHCPLLASVGELWNSWNAFGIYSRDNATVPMHLDPEFKIDPQWFNTSYPHLPDSIFDAPYSTAYPHDMEGKVDPTTLTGKQLLYLHCWPRMDSIRDKLAAVRRAHPELETVYLMTNGEDQWVSGLIELLLEDGWRSVRSSKELVLSNVAQAVSQGVDMAVGNWAEVFVGNGVRKSTLNGGVCRADEMYGRRPIE